MTQAEMRQVEITEVEERGNQGFPHSWVKAKVNGGAEEYLFDFFPFQDEPWFLERVAISSRKLAGDCENCGLHKATETWVGEGGILGFTHGMSSEWCDCCVIQAQLKFCKEAAARLAGLE